MDTLKAIKKYLEWKGSYAPRASVNYRIWLDKFNQLVKKELEEVEIDDVVKFRIHLDNHYSPASVQFGVIVIKNFLKFWKLQNVNCLSPELIKLPRAKAKSHRAVSYEDYRKLLSICKNYEFHDLQRMLIICLLWETGIRVSELCDLNLSNIDHLKKSAIINTKKNGKQRQIFWSDETNRHLINFIAMRLCLNQASALFIGRVGRSYSHRITSRSVQRAIKELCERAGIQNKITPHSFRHGRAHRILERGGTVADVSQILGHSDPSSSFTYLQWNNKELERRAKMFF